MKLSETMLMSLAIALMVIGLHQSTVHGFTQSYWIFMLMISVLAVYQLVKNKRIEKEKDLPVAMKGKPSQIPDKGSKNKRTNTAKKH